MFIVSLLTEMDPVLLFTACLGIAWQFSALVKQQLIWATNNYQYANEIYRTMQCQVGRSIRLNVLRMPQGNTTNLRRSWYVDQWELITKPGMLIEHQFDIYLSNLFASTVDFEKNKRTLFSRNTYSKLMEYN